MKKRFCMYCQTFRADEGFKFLVNFKTGTKRGQCPVCQEQRKKPREELEKESHAERAARRASDAQAIKEAKERKLRDEKDTGYQ